MEIEKKYQFAEYLIDKQFVMIGEKIRFRDIPEDGNILIGKKKVRWYEGYLFKDEIQYEEWKAWMKQELEKFNCGHYLNDIDMIYGLNYRLIPENTKRELTLF